MSLVPTGTITFLFTDIEGSTKLWEQHPDAMRDALARHDVLLRRSIEGDGGHVFKTVGDAFCAAFPTADQALDAALAAQLALTAEPWLLPAPLLVRMALHTGTYEARDGDYFGPSLNRVARLMAAGHGGQVLISGATRELIQDTLPCPASLQHLGENRLKDLGRPENVFQLLHPDLPADFPPLQSLDNPGLPNNLPRQATSFIGREKQVEETKRLLAGTRLLTLTGAGGSGKTRLCLQVAADLLGDYGDGVWLVELAALSDPALVPPAAAAVLGVKEQGGQPIQQALVEALKARRLLLVLDNCEHLLGACASFITELLRSCPDVRVLASSREALNIAGEQTYRVPSLALPDPKQVPSPLALSQYEAVMLFIERARLVRPDFAVTDANAAAVAQVCWRLDGIPFAIELAAARVRAMPLEQLNRRLDDRFHLLTGGTRTLLPRQQTLKALIDWSYDLLSEQERALLRRLSVFVGGWVLGAAEAVCSGGGVEDWEVLDLMTGLLDKSLAVYEETPGGRGRYRLLETVCQYARERLEECGEERAVRRRHRDEFLRLAEQAGPEMQGPQQTAWLDRLEEEHSNLRAALDRCLEDPDGAQPGLRLAGDLFFLWWIRGHFAEGQRHYAAALGRAGAEEPTAARARALSRAGGLLSVHGDAAAARPLFDEGLAIARAVGDRKGEANLLCNLGDIATGSDGAAACAALQESLAIHREIGNPSGSAHAALLLANVALSRGEHAEAQALFAESLSLNRALGNPQKTGHALWGLARSAMGLGDHAHAHPLLEECVALFRTLHDPWGLSAALAFSGEAAMQVGDHGRARPLLEEHLHLVVQLGMPHSAPWPLRCFGRLAAGRGDWARSARAFGAADTFQRAGESLSPEESPALAAARAALGAQAFAAAWSVGRGFSLEQAAGDALWED